MISTRVRDLGLLLLMAGCLFFARLGRLPLAEPDEGRNAEVAREMTVSHDWITPHFDSLPYLDKPAVFFWLVGGSFRLFGVSEWAARLPSALAALATLFLAWFLAERTLGGPTALRAGTVFAVTPLVVIFARQVIFDMTLALLVTLTMTCFWLAEESGFTRRWASLVMFAAAGVATITKGPVGFILPLLSILAYEALRDGIGDLKKLRWGWGLAVFLAVSLPWFIAVSARHPDFPRYAFWDESLLRFASGRSHRGGGVFYYIPVFFAGFLPWSFPLVYAAWGRRRRWRELRTEGGRPTLFFLVWAVVTFIFFSISRSKLPGYVLPAMIPLSILMARVWQELSRASATGRPPDWLTGAFATLMLLGVLAALSPQLLRMGTLQHRLAARMPPATLALLPPTLLYSGLILVALGILGRQILRHAGARGASWIALIILALTFPLLLLRWMAPLESYAAADSSRNLARTILASPDKNLPVYGYYYFRASLPFYLQRPVGLVTSTGAETTSNYVVSRFGRLQDRSLNGRGPILASAAVLNHLAGAGGLLILTRNEQEPELTGPARDVTPVWTGWQYSVWTARPSPR